jgi:hypothetical protein
MIAMTKKNHKGASLVAVDPSLLEWAEYWYPISWKGVLGGGFITALGACATIIFLLLQWRTTTIREEQSDWRTSVLEAETAKAKAELGTAQADIAKATAETAKANERAALANRRAAEINAKYGARELTPELIDALASKLRGAPLKVLIREEPSPEAHIYGYHFIEAFKRAGIEWRRELAKVAPPYSGGLYLIDADGKWQTRYFTPGMQVLMTALREIGIDFRTDWLWQTTPRASDDNSVGEPPKPPDGFVLLYIGPKPIPRSDPTAPLIPR